MFVERNTAWLDFAAVKSHVPRLRDVTPVSLTVHRTIWPQQTTSVVNEENLATRRADVVGDGGLDPPTSTV